MLHVVGNIIYTYVCNIYTIVEIDRSTCMYVSKRSVVKSFETTAKTSTLTTIATATIMHTTDNRSKKQQQK